MKCVLVCLLALVAVAMSSPQGGLVSNPDSFFYQGGSGSQGGPQRPDISPAFVNPGQGGPQRPDISPAFVNPGQSVAGPNYPNKQYSNPQARGK